MTITVEFLAIVIGLLITIATFLYSRFREAEARGRLLQRIDTLEKTLDEVRGRSRETEEKVGCHESDLGKLSSELEALRDIVERVEAKVDKLIQREG